MTTVDRPQRRSQVRQFSVGNEIVLVAPDHSDGAEGDESINQAVTLNSSSSIIWSLCDGKRSTDEVVDALLAQFPVERDFLVPQVGQVLSELSRLGFLERREADLTAHVPTTFVIGIEDKPYFWWQTAIFLESFRGKLPLGWKTYVVVCNNRHPISHELQAIFDAYETDFDVATNHAQTNLIDVGNKGGECHAALNRVEALAVAGQTVGKSELIALLDSDIFLYGDLNLDIMPNGCAMPRNWHIEKDIFFSTVDINKGKGIDLHKLLDAMGCEQQFLPGGVNVFMTGEVAQNEKVIADCFRFAHALFLLARAADVELAWIAEMPCFALALTANNIKYELREEKELLVSDCDEESIPAGTLYHYYSDPGDFGRAAFRDSKWHKQAYRDVDFLRSDLRQLSKEARTDHERYFFQLAKAARDRLDV
ncbi:MAG: PqqD family protein [Alphaproteobacteria bacterium]|nr:PqqD family protein [Alphaproteobacteria bacterium]